MSWMKIIRVAAVIAVAVPLLGMDGCAQSQYPLSSREEGFVDPYLLGDWYRGYVSESGHFRPEQLHLEIVTTGDEMRVRWHDEDQYCDLTGYTTRFRDKKYANLRLVDCSYWTATEKTAKDFDACPYHLIQYKTFMPAGLADYIDESSRDPEVSKSTVITAAEAQRGRTLFYSFLWGDPLKRAIEAGELAGLAECEDCGSEGPCVQADAEDLQEFLFDRDAEMYQDTLRTWVVAVRGDD